MEANNLQWYPPHKQKMIWVKNVESRIDSVSRQCRLEDPPCRDKLEKQAISCKPLQWSCQWPLQLQETMRGVSAISLPVHLLPVSFGCLPWLPLCAAKVGSCCHLIAVNWCHPCPPGPPGVLIARAPEPGHVRRFDFCLLQLCWVLFCRLLLSLDCI